jgi:hypothetical protein
MPSKGFERSPSVKKSEVKNLVGLSLQKYGEYQLSAIKDSRESIKNREYFLKFEAKFKMLTDTK